MLKLAVNPTFKADVKIRAAGGETHTVKFEFKHKTKDELDSFISGEEWRGAPDEKNIMAIAVGWEDVDAPFNEASLKLLFQLHQAAPANIVGVYLSELTGAKLGN